MEHDPNQKIGIRLYRTRGTNCLHPSLLSRPMLPPDEYARRLTEARRIMVEGARAGRRPWTRRAWGGRSQRKESRFSSLWASVMLILCLYIYIYVMYSVFTFWPESWRTQDLAKLSTWHPWSRIFVRLDPPSSGRSDTRQAVVSLIVAHPCPFGRHPVAQFLQNCKRNVSM